MIVCVEDSTDLLVILVRIMHHFCSFLPLLFEFLLGLANFFLFFCHPLFKLKVFTFEGSW